jgi:hypothetical protein
VRLFNRFLRQQPFEIVEELANFSAAQLGFEVGLLEFYCKRQPTISEHQETITRYLRLRHFGHAEAGKIRPGDVIWCPPGEKHWQGFFAYRPEKVQSNIIE